MTIEIDEISKVSYPSHNHDGTMLLRCIKYLSNGSRTGVDFHIPYKYGHRSSESGPGAMLKFDEARVEADDELITFQVNEDDYSGGNIGIPIPEEEIPEIVIDKALEKQNDIGTY